VLDAQYDGVAQSRRRVFGVFARGDIGVERCAEILLIREGMRRNPPPSRAAGKGVAGSLTGGTGGGSSHGKKSGTDREGFLVAIGSGAMVRRLTPLECLRLMSFPDTWFDGLGFSDSTKYKMCGNAVVVNTVEWIGKRIAECQNPFLKGIDDGG
jgi:DNA (cytosine-5)-methyltransferase 1